MRFGMEDEMPETEEGGFHMDWNKKLGMDIFATVMSQAAKSAKKGLTIEIITTEPIDDENVRFVFTGTVPKN